MDRGLAKFETTDGVKRFTDITVPLAHLAIGIDNFLKMNTHSCGHLLVITGYFYGIIHSINGVSSEYL